MRPRQQFARGRGQQHPRSRTNRSSHGRGDGRGDGCGERLAWPRPAVEQGDRVPRRPPRPPERGRLEHPAAQAQPLRPPPRNSPARHRRCREGRRAGRDDPGPTARPPRRRDGHGEAGGRPPRQDPCHRLRTPRVVEGAGAPHHRRRLLALGQLHQQTTRLRPRPPLPTRPARPASRSRPHRRADRDRQRRPPRQAPPPLQNPRRLPGHTNRTRRIRMDHTPPPGIPRQPHRQPADRPPGRRSTHQPTPMARADTPTASPRTATRQRTTRPLNPFNHAA